MTRVALVTGAARNIGRATALALARDGTDVIVHCRTSVAAADAVACGIREAGRRAIVVVADLAEPTGRDALIAQTRAFGSPDIVVLNAAFRSNRSILALTPAELSHVFATTVLGALACIQAFVPTMVERGWGRVIALGGIHSSFGVRGHAHVSAVKAALEQLIKGLALEVGGTGITANLVAPGPIDTEGVDEAGRRHKQGVGTQLPIGRLGTADEVAAACAFLASAGAAFITGEVIRVNGGGHL